MTTVTFPTSLPCPLRDPYRIRREPTFLSSTVNGNPKRRVPYNILAPRVVTVEFNLTWAELSVFEVWFENDLRHGENAYETPYRTAQGLQLEKARIIGAYSYRAISYDRVVLSFEAEVEYRLISDRLPLNDIDGRFPTDELPDEIDGGSPTDAFTNEIDGGAP